ncbi:MAG: YceH family protein [Actinomycetota bacterium]|nr:YceH family protein [Actinomycetota bacterium]
MHFGELTAPEQRVLGCLIEKRWTTPDQYPLSLNALRLACNQSTSRDPVTDYDEAMVREAAQRLCRYGLARLASGHTSRATKYRHLAEEALRVGREELAVLSVLLLRGPQTPGELKARAERMARFESLGDVERVLEELVQADYARRLARRPGHKEDRFEHLLGSPGHAEPTPAATESEPSAAGDGAPPAEVRDEVLSRGVRDAGLADRVGALEAEIASVRAKLDAELASVRAELERLRDQPGSASPTR